MTRPSPRLPAALSAFVLLSLGLAACYGGPNLDGAGALGSVVPTATNPVEPPGSNGEAGSCGSASLWVDYAPMDVKTLVERGFGFVSARVTSTEPAFFNTADGSAPAGYLTTGSGPGTSSATVFTPYVVEVDHVMTGDGNVGVRRVLVEGGDVGCIRVTVDGAAKLAVDLRYVLVLADAKDVDGNDLKDLQRVLDAWPIDPSGIVGTVDGPLSLDALSGIVRDAAASAP